MNEQVNDQNGIFINGIEDEKRIESRLLEDLIQQHVAAGHRNIEVQAFGQHGIGGRLWKAGNEKVYVKIHGSPGQRTGSLGFPNTKIEVMGPVSDDVGWLNAGAEITVFSNAANGAANAMGQGKIFVAGNIGSRGMTMTKHNPRFDPPELWVLGSVGDYFAEFMAGGIAVVCGENPQDSENILGYRPCVGMVGGRIYFRGPHKGFSQGDAKMIPITDDDWDWLKNGLEDYLNQIKKPELLEKLTKRKEWQLLEARTPQDKYVSQRRSMEQFHKDVWDEELGPGGMVGDLIAMDTSPIPLITTGDMRRFVPVWENKKYAPPCQSTCPTGIPIHERWRLVRDGRVDEAVDLALNYTPFPATVCGYLCPNPCMGACTRQTQKMPSVDITKLGQESIKAKTPELPKLSGKKIAIIGGGVAGISMAWQLRQMGHDPVIYDRQKELGGKLSSVIPGTRIPKEVLNQELKRIKDALQHIHLQQDLKQEDIEQMKADFDYIVVAS